MMKKLGIVKLNKLKMTHLLVVLVLVGALAGYAVYNYQANSDEGLSPNDPSYTDSASINQLIDATYLDDTSVNTFLNQDDTDLSTT